MGDKKGVLAIVSGFSGAGKGTIMKSLMERYGEEYGLSISATTRAPRPGEENAKTTPATSAKTTAQRAQVQTFSIIFFLLIGFSFICSRMNFFSSMSPLYAETKPCAIAFFGHSPFPNIQN